MSKSNLNEEIEDGKTLTMSIVPKKKNVYMNS